MAGTTSVSGLVSGLDTATIISQLMQVESQTQTNLKTRVSTEQSNVKTLQDLNAGLASLATSAANLAKTSAWNPVTVTSSSDQVGISADANAVAGSVSFTVGHTALAQQLTFAQTVALNAPSTSGSTHVTLTTHDGTTHDLDTGDGSLAGLVNALNASGTGVRASTTRLDDGSYRLQVTSTITGAASDFTLTNTDGSALLGGATVRAGRDAEITLGTDVLHSATNTFTDIAGGLTVTLKPTVAEGTVVNVSVAQDPGTIASSVKALVSSINDVLTKIDGLTGYDASTKVSGPLADDAAVRELRNALVDTVYPTDGSSLASAGIQLDRNGKLVFDADAFTAAYAADPAGVASKFTTGASNGFAARVANVAKGASDPISGTVTTSINGRNTGIQRMQEDIADWDDRLALRQESLQRQFTALETALSQLNSQSSWLSGQLSKLSSGS